MLLTPHTLVGIVIASKIGNPAIGLPLAFLSHFLGDRVPHWDFFTFNPQAKITPKIFLLIMLDFFLGLLIGLFFTFRALPNLPLAATVFTAAFLANLPDGLEVPVIFFGRNNSWIRKLTDFQRWNQTRMRLPWGLFTQIFVIEVCLWLLLLT